MTLLLNIFFFSLKEYNVFLTTKPKLKFTSKPHFKIVNIPQRYYVKFNFFLNCLHFPTNVYTVIVNIKNTQWVILYISKLFALWRFTWVKIRTLLRFDRFIFTISSFRWHHGKIWTQNHEINNDLGLLNMFWVLLDRNFRKKLYEFLLN